MPFCEEFSFLEIGHIGYCKKSRFFVDFDGCTVQAGSVNFYFFKLKKQSPAVDRYRIVPFWMP